jgi:hypothetical protein
LCEWERGSHACGGAGWGLRITYAPRTTTRKRAGCHAASFAAGSVTAVLVAACGDDNDDDAHGNDGEEDMVGMIRKRVGQ